MPKPQIPAPPETWGPAHRLTAKLLRPLERFLHIEASSGIMLLVAAVVALVWANSPWGDSYDHLWHTPITFAAGSFIMTESLHFWINEGLMAIFFFVVGLEIRREIHEGELADLRRASLPIAAALGGMVAPALIYISLNSSPDVRQGWGVPMATDIAFAVGVLALLGSRVPPALRVLLLALAIIDDIGAILVIALFYSAGVDWAGLAIAVGGIAGVVVFQRLGVRHPFAYVLPGAVVWTGMLEAGVHPTIAGVVLGLLTPVRSWFGAAGFLSIARLAVDEFRNRAEREDQNDHDLLAPLRRLKEAHREAVPPVVRIQAGLHPWVAFGIMPLFALANAGVRLDGLSLDDSASKTVLAGITAGLVLGKPLGILLFSYAGVRLGICALPKGVTWTGVGVVGAVAGIGFTMAIFIAKLAFGDSAALLPPAKLGVLMASGLAAIIGLTVGRVLLTSKPISGAAETLKEAERSTER